MNIEMAKTLSFYGGTVCAIIGLIWTIWYMSRKGELPSPESEEYNPQKKFLGIVWLSYILISIYLLFNLFKAPANVGERGIWASLLVGLSIPVLFSSLQSSVLKLIKNDGKVALSAFSSLPLGILGISLLYGGYVVKLYGINADNYWLSFIIGLALGGFLVRFASHRVNSVRYESVADQVDAAVLVVCCALLAVILSSHHFPKNPERAFIPLQTLLGIFLSFFLSVIPFVVSKGKNIMRILPAQMAIFCALFLGMRFYLVMPTRQYDLNYPVFAGIITSIIIIVMMYGSAVKIRRMDLSSGAMGVLLILAGLWFSFKWGLGLGISLYALGLAAPAVLLTPLKSLEDYILQNKLDGFSLKEQPVDLDEAGVAGVPCQDLTWAGLYLRSVTRAGIFALLAVLFRIFVQSSSLLDTGLDIAVGDAGIALLFGAFVSFLFEGLNLMGDNVAARKRDKQVLAGTLLFLAAVIGAGVVMACAGLFFRLEGLGAFIMGLSVTAMIGSFIYFSRKRVRDFYRSATSTLWVAAAASSIFLLKFKDLPDKMTRANKQKWIVILMGLILLVYVIAHFSNRGADEEPPRQV